MTITNERLDLNDSTTLNSLAVAAQGGDCRAASDLVHWMRPFVVGYLRRLNQDYLSWDERDDLEQTVWAGVWKALKTFDPDKGTKFSTWAHLPMKGAAMGFFAARQAVPITVGAWKVRPRLEAAWEATGNPAKFLSEATDAELAALRVPRTRNGVVDMVPVPSARSIIEATSIGGVYDPEADPRPSKSAEDTYFDAEQAVLVLAESLLGVEQGDWPDAVAPVASEHDIDPEVLLAGVTCYLGEVVGGGV